MAGAAGGATGGSTVTPSSFRMMGCIYAYNAGGLCGASANSGTRKPQADPVNGLAGKHEAWAPEPSRYILAFEPGGAAGFY